MPTLTVERTIVAPVHAPQHVGAGDVVWDSVFTVRPVAAADGATATALTMTMEARANAFFPRLLMPLIWGMLTQAINADIDAVKAACERGSGA